MSTSARLGLIVIAGLVVFAGALFVLADRSLLLANTFQLNAEFNRVSGLQPGASVNYRGIRVGRVSRVTLPAAPGLPIRVTMAINTNSRHLIRRDTQAAIQTDGIVGDMMVTLTAGTPTEPVVEVGGTISGVDPLDLGQFSDMALTSVARFDSVTVTMTQIMQDIRTGEGTLGRFLYDESLYNELLLTGQESRLTLQNLGRGADALVLIAADASRGVNEIIRKVNEGDGSFARILNEDSLYIALLESGRTLEGIADDVRQVTDRMENAANWAALGAFRFSENMEALKHNFLFRPYFQDRGYLELAPFEVRERALSESYRDIERRERELFQLQLELEQRQRGVGFLPERTDTAPGATEVRLPPQP